MIGYQLVTTDYYVHKGNFGLTCMSFLLQEWNPKNELHHILNLMVITLKECGSRIYIACKKFRWGNKQSYEKWFRETTSKEKT